MSHQSQVTRRGISYEYVFFSSATIPGDNFHCVKRFAVVPEEVSAEGLFDKEPAPPPPEIQNSTAPPSAPGDPIEAGVFNTYNWAEEIDIVGNQGIELDDGMEQAPKNVHSVDSFF